MFYYKKMTENNQIQYTGDAPGVSAIIHEVLKSAQKEYDLSQYDSNNDGLIDAIHVVYSKKMQYNSDDFWWAFQYCNFEYKEYDDVCPYNYVFSSFHFLFENNESNNARTLIHETGHLFGLDDYYDYDESNGANRGMYAADMMDYNVGDHNAYSKLMLGWITPYVLTGQDVTLDLQSFAATGECIMICKNWNGSFFDEYYIIDFYTPTGLNEMGKGESGLFSVNGIRIYHIDATLKDPSECFSVWEVTKYDNSYTEHRLIRLVEADGNSDIDDWGWSGDSDLFQVGNIYSDAYWYDNTKAGFTLIVNSITDTSASITITF